ncbi:MAG TPA: PD-(D/E)XK nuclease family protein [Bacteroidia bacterium]|nr:PD-(D/E)XK nuclease family protein [Bacteroidia bacterium]
MKNFIEFIGNKIIEQNEFNNELVIVFPNKRPVAYLQKYLAEKLNKAIWFPKIYTIEEFVIHISNFQLADVNYTASCLYEIYVEVMQDQADSFDDFLKWWNLLISDFNDIDMYMVNTEQLFNYINEAKAIEQWNLGEKKLSNLQQHYISFWKQLSILYKGLNYKLCEQNLGYRGMIYKKACEIVCSDSYTPSMQKVFFAGFNALSTSEEKIVEYFVKHQIGYVLWEADAYYLNDENQEAGKFLRYYQQKWQNYPNSIFYCPNNLLQTSLELKIIGAPKSMMQATIAGRIMESSLAFNNKNLALIPADENLLNPLLYQLPINYVDSINISMGYPIIALSLSGLYDILFEVFNLLEKSKQNIFPSKIIHQLLNHPYAPLLFGSETQSVHKEINSLKNTILKSGKTHYSLSDLQNLQSIFTKLNFYSIFEDFALVYVSLHDCLSLLYKINQLLSNSNQVQESQKQILIHQVELFNSVLDEVKKVYFNEQITLIKQSKTILSLIKQALQGFTLPFIGNSTGGVQFIGLLETRMLQFDEVIITGCNEGILPNAKASGNSFIPFDIRNQFNLPTYKDSEAVFAYHFYRLIQGAKIVHLIYNTETDEFGSGEKSRFLSQLEMELQNKNPKASVVNEIMKLPPLDNFKRKSISFKHTPTIDVAINNLLEKGLSATALISYKNCALQFYFKYIEKIKEPEEFADEVAANIVGSVIHKVLEEVYSPLKLSKIKIEQLQLPFESIVKLTTKAFLEIESGVDTSTGKNLLFIQTAAKIVAKFLNYEIQQITNGHTIKILYTETAFDTRISIDNKNIKLHGTIDRIDEFDNVIRIIDYKTGSVDARKLKIQSIDEVFQLPEYDKAFQLFFYLHLYNKNNSNIKKGVESGILSLRKINDGVQKLIGDESMETLLSVFEEKLNELISRLFHAENPFVQTDYAEICTFCAYRNICMK